MFRFSAAQRMRFWMCGFPALEKKPSPRRRREGWRVFLPRHDTLNESWRQIGRTRRAHPYHRRSMQPARSPEWQYYLNPWWSEEHVFVTRLSKDECQRRLNESTTRWLGKR